MFDDDPKLTTGAYITDGTDLFEVRGVQRGSGTMGASTVRVVVEDCRNFRRLEFFPEKIREAFELVRDAPTARCPDVVGEIGW